MSGQRGSPGQEEKDHFWAEVEARQQRYDALVERAIQRTLASVGPLAPPVVDHIFYGATGIDPKNLVIWFAFADEAAVAQAKAQGHADLLRRRLLAVLAEEGYPPKALDAPHIGFVGKKEVDDAGGPWMYFR